MNVNRECWHRAEEELSGNATHHAASVGLDAAQNLLERPNAVRTLFFDAQSGAAGDMIVGALIDLGVPWPAVRDAVLALPLQGVTVDVAREYAGVIAARRLEVTIDAAHQAERSYADITRLLDASELTPNVKALCARVFARLARAEAKVHGIGLDDVHFHEVGAADSIVDIVAACAAIDYLGAQLVTSPLPLGRGYTECRHGVIPLPAPATVECLVGLQTFDSGLEVELVTPTAAAILGELCAGSERWPSGTVCAVGYGKGTRSLPDRPNVLRTVLLSHGSAISSSNVCWLLEANIDDMDGERLGHAVEQLLRAGALDAWTTPLTMKKGRPAWKISALCRPSDFAGVEASLFAETTTLGVRRSRVERTELARETRWVDTPYGVVPIKVSGGETGAFYRTKPEFDVCQKYARQANVSVSVVIEAARQSVLSGAWRSEQSS